MNIHSFTERLFYDKTGQFLVSALFGLALALMFRRVCKENCIVFYAPDLNDIVPKSFQLEGTCYKYEPYNVECSNDAIITNNDNDEASNKIKENTFFNKIFN